MRLRAAGSRSRRGFVDSSNSTNARERDDCVTRRRICESVQIWHSLVTPPPRAPENRLGLDKALQNIGVNQMWRQQFSKARISFQTSLQAKQRVYQLVRNYVDIIVGVASTYSALGRLCLADDGPNVH